MLLKKEQKEQNTDANCRREFFLTQQDVSWKSLEKYFQENNGNPYKTCDVL